MNAVRLLWNGGGVVFAAALKLFDAMATFAWGALFSAVALGMLAKCLAFGGAVGLGIAIVLAMLLESVVSPERAWRVAEFMGIYPGLAFGLRLWWVKLPLPLKPRTGDTTHGSARFADAGDVAALDSASGGLLIGRNRETGALLRYDGPAHLLTLAPTRAGKGVGTVIPNLLMADRPMLVIDPKGENARIAGAARAAFGPVHILDPFGVTGKGNAALNPMDRLHPDSLDLGEDATTLADALVMDPPGQSQDAHWNEEAKALLSGLILFAALHEDAPRRTLATVREYLTLPPDGFQALLGLMQESDRGHGLIARAANRFLGKADREAASVLSGAQRHTHFLDSPRMASVLDRSTFRFADLRRGVCTVFLVLPPNRLDAYARWLRLMVSESLHDIARHAETAPGGSQSVPGAIPASIPPVTFLLDEFAALGRLEAVERAMGLMAGYGVQLWPILQDRGQLKALYGEQAETFVANAGVLQVFGVNDPDTATWLSRTFGKETIAYHTRSHRPIEPHEASLSEHLTGRDLITPDEVMRLPADLQLLRLQGTPPLVARKLRYYADPEFQTLPGMEHRQTA